MLESPYMGLTAFSEDDSAFFCGRDTERRTVASYLMAFRLSVVYGASGVGKSSLLRAGLMHDLKLKARDDLDETGSPGFAATLIADWHGDIPARIEESVRQSVATALEDEPPELRDATGSLVDRWRRWAGLVGGHLFLILDQFEDYLRNNPNVGDDPFAELLAGLLSERGLGVNVLIAIRDDAFNSLDRLTTSIPDVLNNRLQISHLTIDSARKAIVEPKDQFNLFYTVGAERIEIEPALIERVLEQVSSTYFPKSPRQEQVSNPNHGIGQLGSIEAPLLQLVMNKLWEAEVGAGERIVRLTTLEDKLQGVKGIVNAHLITVMKRLSRGEKDVVAQIFRDLIAPSGARAPCTASLLAERSQLDEEQVASLLERLSGDERILRSFTPPGSNQERLYEIFHDFLAEPVDNWRADYINEKKKIEARSRLRRRVLVTAGLALMVIAVAIVWTWQMQREREERKRQQDELQMVFSRLSSEDEPDRETRVRGTVEILDRLRRVQQEADDKAGQAFSLNFLGGAKRTLGANQPHANAKEFYDQAEGLYREAIELTVGGELSSSLVRATSLNDLGHLFYLEGRFRDAAAMFEQSLDICEIPRNYLPAETINNIISKLKKNLASCYQRLGRYDQAEKLFLAVEKNERSLEPADGKVLETQTDLAWLYYYRGAFGEAERRLEQIIELNHEPESGAASSDLAWIYYEHERYQDAKARFTEISQSQSNSLQSVVARTVLASIYQKRREFKSTRDELISRAFWEHASLLEREPHPTIADAIEIARLAKSLEDLKYFSAAEQEFNRVVEIWQYWSGPQHPDTAIAEGELASFYYRQNQYDKAESLLRNAGTVLRSVSQSPDLAKSLFRLGQLYSSQEQFKKAKQALIEARRIQEEALHDHPDLAATLEELANLFLRTGRKGKADQLHARADLVRKQHKINNPGW